MWIQLQDEGGFVDMPGFLLWGYKRKYNNRFQKGYNNTAIVKQEGNTSSKIPVVLHLFYFLPA